MGRRGHKLDPTGDWQVNYTVAKTLSQTVINFCNALPTPDGQPFKLLPWQEKFIRNVFRRRRGKRVVRTAVLSCGRKNGKTGLASVILLAHGVGCLQTPAAELYSVASDREQASIIFSMVQNILLQCPALLDQANIIRHHRRIEFANGSQYKALASDADRLLGLSPKLVIYDELGVAKNRKLFDSINTAFGAQAESLLMITSTQNHDDHHVMSEVYDYAQQVVDGEVEDETYYAQLYSTPQSWPINSPKSWHQANPSLGKVRNESELKTRSNQLIKMPQGEGAFRNLYLNQRVKVSDEPWIAKNVWDACRQPIDEDSLRGQQCVIGIDMSSVIDLSAYAIFFPLSGYLLVRCWCPKKTADKPSNTPYRSWEREGLLTITRGEAINTDDIYEAVMSDSETFDVVAVGYDRWRMEDAVAKFSQLGLDEKILKKVGMGYFSMSPAVDAFERLVLRGKLKHNNPILTWAMSNVRLDSDPSGNRKPNKTTAKDKIDPLVASLIAVSLAHNVKPENDIDLSNVVFSL